MEEREDCQGARHHTPSAVHELPEGVLRRGDAHRGEHIMDDGSIGASTCTTDSFLDMKQKMVEKKAEKSKGQGQGPKAVAAAKVDEAWRPP